MKWYHEIPLWLAIFCFGAGCAVQWVDKTDTYFIEEGPFMNLPAPEYEMRENIEAVGSSTDSQPKAREVLVGGVWVQAGKLDADRPRSMQ